MLKKWMLEIRRTTPEASKFILAKFVSIQNGLGSIGLLEVIETPRRLLL